MSAWDDQNIEDIYPLSSSQSGIYFHSQLDEQNTYYHDVFYIQIRAEFDQTAFEIALSDLLDRHPVLRTSFDFASFSRPMQIVHKQGAIRIACKPILEDISSAEKMVGGYIEELFESPFDLSQKTQFRLTLVPLSDESFYLLVDAHHIVLDGWSMAALLTELFQRYAGRLGVIRRPHFHTIHSSFKSFVKEEMKCINSSEHREFWSKYLKNVDYSAINPLPGQFKTAGVPLEQSVNIPDRYCRKIDTFSKNCNVSVKDVLLAVHFRIMGFIFNTDQPISCLGANGRLEQLGGQEVAGLFVNLMPMYMDLVNESWENLVRRVSAKQRELVKYRRYPFSEMVRDHGSPISDVVFNYTNFHVYKALQGIDEFEIISGNIVEKNNTPLTVAFHQGLNANIKMVISYHGNLFTDDFVSNLLQYYTNALDSLTENPESEYFRLNLLTSAERKILCSLNSTQTKFPREKCIHELFEDQALKDPYKIAIVDEDESLNYQDVNSQSNQVAHYLLEQDVTPDTLVALYGERSVNLIVGMLGILKAGCAYVPIDPRYPDDRIEHMLTDSRVYHVLIDSELMSDQSLSDKKVLPVDSYVRNALLSHYSNENIDKSKLGLSSSNLAYVIYTSGSTGFPKGTELPHLGLVNLAIEQCKEFGLSARSRVIQFASFSFDAAISEWAMALCSGASLYICSDETKLSMLCLSDFMVKHSITHATLPPALLPHIDFDREYSFESLIVAGEACDENTAWRLAKKYRLFNAYGPTETTVCASISQIVSGEPITLGRALGNFELHVLDKHKNLMPIGMQGELYIGGVGLAKGYLNQPALSNNNFIECSIEEDTSVRLFKTGDLVRRWPDGNLSFMGRIDNQIKIRGYRIEVEEIESILNEHSGIERAVVIGNDQKLKSYIIPEAKTSYPVKKMLEIDRSGRWGDVLKKELPNGLIVGCLNHGETEAIYTEIFDQQCYVKHGIKLNPGACVFDVGANIGLFSIFVNQVCRDARIYAFEPIPSVFDALEFNATLYGLDVRLFQFGLSDKPQWDNFAFYLKNSALSSRYANAQEEREVVEEYLRNQHGVELKSGLLSEAEFTTLLEESLETEMVRCELRTISQIIEEDDIDQIDLLKIDVEKSELDVLYGISTQDWPKIKQIVIEVHNTDDQLNIIESILREYDYDWVVEQDSLLEGTSLLNIYAIHKTYEESINIREENILAERNHVWNSRRQLVEDVRKKLSEKLPDYMIPSAFFLLESLPLNNNGKIDINALPEPDLGNQIGANYVAPRSPIEEKLCIIWQDLLRLDQVGIHDNFFEIGGDSILSIQIVSRANREGISLSTRHLFEYPTIAELADKGAEGNSTEVSQEAVDGRLDLLPLQSQFLNAGEPDLNHFNQAVLLQMSPTLSEEILSALVKALYERHDALRLRFKRTTPEQWEAEHAPLTQSMVSESYVMEAIPSGGEGFRISERCQHWQRSLDISNGPLLKVVYFYPETNMPGEFAHLFIVAHHLVVDGVSWRILIKDIVQGYGQYVNDEVVRLADKSTSLKRWGEALNEYAGSTTLNGEVGYWLAQHNNNVEPLPVDMEVSESPKIGSTRYLNILFSEDETLALLHNCPRAYRTQINELLLAGFYLGVRAWTGENNLRLTVEGHGRDPLFEDLEVNETVGWFTSAYPLVLNANGSGVGEVIKAVKDQYRAIPKKGIGYGALLEVACNSELRDAAYKFPSQISFNYLGQFDQSLDSYNLFKKSDKNCGESFSALQKRKHLLGLNGLILDGRLKFTLDYSDIQYRSKSMEKLSALIELGLRQVIEHCTDAKSASYAPSDFPLAAISQGQLDILQKKYPNLVHIYPATPMQQGMMFHSLLDRSAYVNQTFMTLKGEVDLKCFRNAWQEVINRHNNFRAVFVGELEELQQLVVGSKELNWHEEDWSEISAEQQIKRFNDYRYEDKRKGFDFSQPLLLRFAVFRLSENRYYFLWTHHHMLMDGWCSPLIYREVLACYRFHLRGEAVALEEPVQYEEYIKWLLKKDKAEASAYWRSELKDIDESIYIGKSAEGVSNEALPKEKVLTLTRSDTNALQELAKKEKTTLNVILQLAWAYVLHRYSGEDEIMLGATVSGRPAEIKNIERIVGLFINTIPVKISFEEGCTVSYLLKDVHERFQRSIEYGYLSLTEIRQQMLSLLPGAELFESILVFENYPLYSEVKDALEGTVVGVDGVPMLEVDGLGTDDASNYKLTLVASIGTSLEVRFFYRSDIFSDDVIDGVLSYLHNVLRFFCRYIDQPIHNIGILSQEEIDRLINPMSPSKDCSIDRCIHELFEAQVKKDPSAIAVAYEDRQFSYGELNEKSNQLAHYLVAVRQVKPDTLVGICVERSLEMVIGIVGILKAGGAYVPLDPACPEARLAYILEDADLKTVLTQGDLQAKTGISDTQAVCFDDEAIQRHLNEQPRTNLDVNTLGLHSNHLAYVIYTSDSAGIPKGVMVEHRSICRLVDNTDYIAIEESDIVAQASNTASDAATFEIWGAFANGATLCYVSKEILLNPKVLGSTLKDNGITVLFITTALFNHISLENPAGFSTLKYLLFGGDKVDRDSVKRVFSTGKPTHLLHVYGPAENTTFSTHHQITEPGEMYPIGRAINGSSCYVLDKYRELLPVGAVGEVYLGGVGVARGYLNRPALTAERFIANPFYDETDPRSSARLYQTGDLGRWLPDGNLELLGRIEDQANKHSLQTELSDMERVLLQHESVKDVAVVDVKDRLEQSQIASYVVVDEGEQGHLNAETVTTRLRAYLRRQTKLYRLPITAVILETMPLKSNGKVDYKALPALDLLSAGLRFVKYVAPRTETERILCRIWAEVLGVERVGVTDNFFQLGGHSLSATRMVARINQAFNVTLPLKTFFSIVNIDAMGYVIDEFVSLNRNKLLGTDTNSKVEIEW